MPLIKARSSSIMESVDLRGQPTAVTAVQATNTNQLASTAFVRTAIAELIDSSPELLNTLAELAAAINDDENFSTTITNSIATKVALDGSVAMTGNLTLSGAPTQNLHAATKLYVDELVDSQMIYSTDDVPEGTSNLYYTESRVKNLITLDSDNTVVLSYDSMSGQFTYNHPTSDGVLEGTTNLYHTTARVRNAISLTSDDGQILSYSASTGAFTFTTPDTDKIVEGSTNLYFQTSRARASVSGGSNIDYDNSTGIISTQAAVWSVNGQNHDVVLDTDDITEGSTNLYFTNVRAAGAVSLTTDDTNILSYNTGTGRFTFVTPSTDAIDEGSNNLYYTDTRVRAAVSGSGDISYNQATGNFSYSTPTTDGVNEGSTNKYYLDSRARNAISLSSNKTSVLSYDNSTGLFTFNLANQTTDDVAEGSLNLYFTQGRARQSISTSGWGNLSYDNTTGVITISAPSTADVTEDSGYLYFTTQRARDSVSATDAGGDGSFSYNDATGVFTYTGPSAAEARAHLSATDLGGDGSFSYDSATGVFTYTGPSATEARAHFSASDAGGDGSFSYDSATGVFTYTGPSATEARAHFSASDAGGDGSFSYNDATGVFTYTGPSAAEARAHFSVSDLGGDGSLSYNDATGVFTYTGPSDAEVRAHFSATTATGAQYNDSTGVFSLSNIPNSSLTNDSVTVNGSTVALGGSTSFGTDSVTEEGNLYYLDSRARSSISLTTNKASVLDYNSTTGVFTFNLANQTTDDVSEGTTNKYFTNARARSAISANDAGGDGSFSYDDVTGVFTYTGPSAAEARAHFSVSDVGGDGSLSYDSATGVFTYTGPSAAEARAHFSATTNTGAQYDSSTGVFSLSGIPNSSLTNSDITINGTTINLGGSGSIDTDAVNEGTSNLYYTQARFNTAFGNKTTTDLTEGTNLYYTQARFDSALAAKDTDDVAEGTSNLYYTTARTRADVSAGTGVSYNSSTGVFSIGQAVGTTDDVTFNDVTISGDLTVNGTLTTINSTDLTVTDKNITIADGAANAAAANGAGITVDGANATITYASATDSWNFNKDVSVSGGLTLTGSLTAPTFVGDLTGDVTGTVSDISNHDTDALAEGSTNLYFTNSRAAAAISLTSDKTSVLSYNSSTGVLTFTIANASTSDIAEGTNLYFTTTRARNSVSVTDNGGDGSLSYNSSTGVIEYTGPSASEARAHFSATQTGGDGSFSYDSSTGVFSYTGPDDADYRLAISATTNTGAQYDNTTGVISLSGIPNSSLTNSSVTVNGASVSLGGSTSFDTDSVNEGTTNKYFLNSRARNAISLTTSDTTVLDYDATTGEFTFNLSGLDTSEVTEDPNATVTSGTMYFTNARARNAVSASDAGGDGSFSYDSGTGVFTYTGPSASEARAHFSANDIGGDGAFSYDSVTGVFTYTGPSAAEARVHFSANDAGGDGSFSYDDVTGVFTYTGPSAAEARAHFSVSDLGGDGSLSYNDATGVFTYTGPSASEARAHFSVSDLGGDGSLSYNDTTGVFTYTGPSASEARAHFSATTNTGAQYDSSTGVFSLSGIPNSSLTNSSITLNGTTVSLGGSNSFDTDSVTEGTTNKYFLDSRARDAISLTTSDSTVLDYDSATGVFTFNLSGLDTSEVTEDPNATVDSGTMYFTNARARASISASGWGNLSYNNTTGVISISAPSTADVSEDPTNLYFTNTRARQAVSLTTDNTDAMSYDNTTGVFTFTLATVDTDEIAEGQTNLYFTTARARNTINNGANIDYDASTGTISTQAAVWSVNGQNHDVVLDTDDINEGSANLYFTDVRAQNALTLVSDDANILSYAAGTLTFVTPTTDAIDEGAVNLYYTDTRADGRIAAASIRDLSDVDADDALQDGYTLVWSSSRGEFVPQNIAVTATTLNFTGDGTTTSFSTGVNVTSIDNTQVYINGLIQAPTYSYTISTTNEVTSIVFDTAPEANDYIFVRVSSTSTLTAGGVLNESSTIDGGTY